MSDESTPAKVEAFLTVPEVAEAFRLSSATIYRRIEAGEIPARRIGNSLRIPSSYLERLVAEWPRGAVVEHRALRTIDHEQRKTRIECGPGEPIPANAEVLFRQTAADGSPPVVDVDTELAVAVPTPFPREGWAYICLGHLELEDNAGRIRKLREGDVLHSDEVEHAGRGIDNLVAQGDVARLPASHGLVGLVGVLLDRVAELESQEQQTGGGA